MFYKIVEATTPEKLSSLVNNNIAAGFEPIGGICHGEGSYLYQSMVLNGIAHQHTVASDGENPAVGEVGQTLRDMGKM